MTTGLVFGSRQYRALVKDYGLIQEYTAPYTPEQNGLCERFIRSFKEECAWLHRFSSLAHARSVITNFIRYFNTLRPHQALNYKSPSQYYQKLCAIAAWLSLKAVQLPREHYTDLPRKLQKSNDP